MSINFSKTSRGVVVVSVPPPRWESLKKETDTKENAPSLASTGFNNVFIYNFFTIDERNRYNGFGRGDLEPNPTFDFSKLNQLKDITGKPLEDSGFYRVASNKVPSFIRLSWSLPDGVNENMVASRRDIESYKMAVGHSKYSAEGSVLSFVPMKKPNQYSNFESQQRDYVRISNEYLDMFSGVNSDGSQVNDWFAEEIDSTGFSDRQNFLWSRVIQDDEEYKNFLNTGNRNNWSINRVYTPTVEEQDSYFNNTAQNESTSMVDVSDSAMLENLDFPDAKAMPEDITTIQNTEFSWRTKLNSMGFSSRILSTQERIRNSNYWSEFMNKLNIKKSSGDIEQILGEQPGPLESTLIRGKAFRTETINSSGFGGVSDFRLIGFVIEKEQVLEPGEKDEPGVPSSEKFPLIFAFCHNTESGQGTAPTTYMDAALNYDKEYKYTIRAIYTFDVTVPMGGNRAQRRSYFVNSTHSNILRVETREVKPPSAPRDVSAFYEYYKTGLTLNWAFPVNPQRDTAYFAIFRRSSIYEPFKLLQVHDFNFSISDPIQSREEIKFLLEYRDYAGNLNDVPNNFDLVKRIRPRDSNTTYTDYYFKPNRDYIYAVCAIDAHGQISNYSAQIKVNLDSKTHRLSIRQISPPGAPLVFPNWFIKSKAFVDVARTARYRRAVLKFRPDYKKIKIGPGTGEVRDIVKTTDKTKGGNSKNCYYLQILNPDRKDDIVLKYQIDDSSKFDMSQYEELEELANLLGLPGGSIGRSGE